MQWTKKIRAQNTHVLGRKYRNDPRGCQDYSISWVEDHGACSIICDGAGGSKRSQHASKAFSETISDFFKSKPAISSIFQLQNEIVKKCKETIIDLIHKHKNEDESNNDAYYSFESTLIFIYIDFSNQRVSIGHIGDGMIIAVKKDRLEVMSKSAVGDGGTHLTYFITDVLNPDQHSQSLLRINQRNLEPDDIGFLCFSDGIEDVLAIKNNDMQNHYRKNNHGAVNPALVNIFNNMDSNLEEIIQKNFVDKGNSDDDCSISILQKEKMLDEDLNKIKTFYNDSKKKSPIPPNPIQIQLLPINITIKVNQIKIQY